MLEEIAFRYAPRPNLAVDPTHQEELLRQLRQYFSASEAEAYGIGESYDGNESKATSLQSVLSGAGAVLATATLLVTVGFLATLDLAHTMATSGAI